MMSTARPISCAKITCSSNEVKLDSVVAILVTAIIFSSFLKLLNDMVTFFTCSALFVCDVYKLQFTSLISLLN